MHSWRIATAAVLLTLGIRTTGTGASMHHHVQGPAYSVTVDAAGDLGTVDHFWSRASGNGNARLQAQEDMRAHLAWSHDEWGMQYTIHHGLFHDSMRIYREDPSGNAVYDWSMFDSCYDYTIRELGMRAHFTFFPMPRDLAASLDKTGFIFNGAPCYLSMPRDLNRWKELCAAVAQHVVDRYGIDVARECFYRVWNENDHGGFSLGTMDDWQRVYDYAVEGVRSVDSRLQVGGPSLTWANTTILSAFLDHCASANYANPSRGATPVDFISYNTYASGSNEIHIGNMGGLNRGLASVKTMLEQRGFLGKVKVHITEYGASWARNYNNPKDNGLSETYGKHDSQLAAAFITYQVGNLLYDWNNSGIGVNNADLIPPVLAYWVMSDVFDEDGVIDRDFINCHGMITRRNSIKKPSFNAQVMLHQLGDRLLPLQHSAPGDTVKGLATRNSLDNSVQVILYNCPMADVTRFIDHPHYLTVNNLTSPTGTVSYELFGIDREHSNAWAVWDAMGRPEPMNAEQLEACRERQDLEHVKLVDEYVLQNGTLRDTILLPGQSAYLAVIRPNLISGTIGMAVPQPVHASAPVAFTATALQGRIHLPTDVLRAGGVAMVYDLHGRVLGRLILGDGARSSMRLLSNRFNGIVQVRIVGGIQSARP